MKITFSVEQSCGEDENAIHLYFGDNVRIKVAEDIEGLELLVDQILRIKSEIQESYPLGINR